MSHEKKLRRLRCCCLTLEDLYVVLCLAVSLVGFAMAALEAFDVFGVETWHRIYVASFIGVGSILCFLQAVPSWRVQSFTPHLLGLSSVSSFGNAGGFLLSYFWEKGIPLATKSAALDRLRERLAVVSSALVNLKLPDLPNYLDAIIFFTAFGICTAILSIIHEFFLKTEKYPRKQPCRYFMFLVAVGIISAVCLALAVLTINPDISSTSEMFNGEYSLGTEKGIPTLVMAILRFLGALGVGVLLFRSWQLFAISKLVIGLIGLLHVAAGILAFFNLHLGSDWEYFPNKFVGIQFSVTGGLILMSNAFGKCCAPKKCKNDRPNSRVMSSNSSIASADSVILVSNRPLPPLGPITHFQGMA